MATFLTLLTSFVIAVAGIVQSSQAPPEKRTFFGLTAVGQALVLIACVGFVASAAKQHADDREVARLKRQADADSQMLKLVNAKLDYISGVTDEPKVAREIEQLRDQMNLSGSNARETDFSLSDFSRSRFDRGNFSQSYFLQALFKDAGFHGARFDGASFEGAAFSEANFNGADLRGADLRGVLIDDDTLLPTHSKSLLNLAAPDAASQRR